MLSKYRQKTIKSKNGIKMQQLIILNNRIIHFLRGQSMKFMLTIILISVLQSCSSSEDITKPSQYNNFVINPKYFDSSYTCQTKAHELHH